MTRDALDFNTGTLRCSRLFPCQPLVRVLLVSELFEPTLAAIAASRDRFAD